MQVLLTDANVLIDLEVPHLTRKAFELPVTFLTPDLLFYDELEQLHSHLLDLGLRVIELSPSGIARVARLVRKYPKPSRNDIIALAAAQELDCPLLTGDQNLRGAAEQEQLLVHGTIWLIEKTVEHGLIDADDALRAYDTMEERGRRLPWADARARMRTLLE